MTTDTTPDPLVSVKLRRLLNAYAVASENRGYCENESTYDVAARAAREQASARTALLDYLARNYVRRDAAGDPPIVTPAVPSREVTVRIVGRERVVSAKYPEECIDGR